MPWVVAKMNGPPQPDTRIRTTGGRARAINKLRAVHRQRLDGQIGLEEAQQVTDDIDVVAAFLNGAHDIRKAIGDPAAADAWNHASVLEDQLVSSLAGHLARGGVWVVSDYLHAEPPPGPADFDSAGEYFASFAASASPDDYRAIRDRGAAEAAVGRLALLESLGERIDALRPELEALPTGRLMTVIGGKVMRFEDYLATRIVQQVVHLDDLARSVGREPWPLTEEQRSIAIAVGIDTAQRRYGSDAVIRALYRKGFAETTLPVL